MSSAAERDGILAREQHDTITGDDLAATAAESPPSRGADLRVSLACPRCGSVGWTEWKNLSRGMGCRQCGCRFRIGSDGHLRSHQNPPATRFVCPRCGQTGMLPQTSLVRAVECGACNLPLVRGPDNRLHGPHELAELKKAAAKSSFEAQIDTLARKRRLILVRRPPAPAAAAAVVLLMAVCAVAWHWRQDSKSPTATVERFTECCLAGDWTAAAAYLADDAVQRAEFIRWRVRYFSSIQAEFRPKGDVVTVRVHAAQGLGKQFTCKVTMTSAFFGTRQNPQCWLQNGNTWTFDAAGTLAAQDCAHAGLVSDVAARSPDPPSATHELR